MKVAVPYPNTANSTAVQQKSISYDSERDFKPVGRSRASQSLQRVAPRAFGCPKTRIRDLTAHRQLASV